MPDFKELWEMLTSLQISDLVLSAAAVVILDLFAIMIIFSAGRESKLCRKRWLKVSAGMELCRERQEETLHYPLEADEILLGRHSSADIQLKDPSVSRYHAVMTVSGGVWSITDLDSKTGTYVNQQKVQQKKLASGDCIRLGNAELYLMHYPEEQEDYD